MTLAAPQITANGGSSIFAGGGGGGRVAIYYQNATGFDFSRVNATGGPGHSGRPNGGAGTVYLQGPARESGELVVDNNNAVVPSLSTPILNVASGAISLTHLRVRSAARVRIDHSLDLVGSLEVNNNAELALATNAVAGNINLANNGLLVQLATTGTASFKVDLNAGSLAIDATSKIDVSGRGFLGGLQPGNPFGVDGMTLSFQRGSTGNTGGSYGGLGGTGESGSPNPAVYGDFRDPNEPGSGGTTGQGRGGNGGGLVRIVAQTLTLNGSILANGTGALFDGGGGSGGAIRIDVGTLSGAGQIRAGGGNGIFAGGGGGGRVAIYYQTGDGFNFSTQVSAGGGSGGNGRPNGQNGTVHLQQQTFMGSLPTEHNEPIMTARAMESNDPVRLAPERVPNACCLARSADIPVLLGRALAEITSADRPQRKVFSPVKLSTQHSEPDGEHTNLYLALVAEGKIKPFATTAMLSQGSGVPGILSANPESDTLTLSRSTNPKSKIENPKSEPLTPDDFDPIYTYDLNGNRTSMIDPTGLTTYTYDALNRLTSITNNKGQITSFTYDALGRRTSMTHANGVVTNYTYDAASQLTRLAHQLGATSINSFDYTYDKVGNRKSKTSRDGLHDYIYDTLNRLTQATNPLPTNPLETFNFDPVGNRINSNQNGASIFNLANQLLEDANFTYQYDNNGNLTLKTPKTPGPFTSYEYDAENKLVRAVMNGTTANYKYDGLGRRVEKEVINVGTTVTRYVYDNEDILLELDGSNNIVARYTHGPGIDEPLILEKNSQSFYYHADGLGSITEMTNQSGTVAQRYTYSSFGKIESQLDANFVQPYTYTSREFDAETGLYFYRARYYDQTSGRFLQEDPIGFAGGINYYSMVSNNPVRMTDAYGLCADEPDPLKKCRGIARVLGGNPDTVGRQGGFPGRRVQTGSIAIDPAQFFPGMTTLQAKIALTPYLNQISGRVRGGQSFNGVTDVIGGESPIAGMNVRDALKSLNPGALIIELVNGKDNGVTEIELLIPLAVPCPQGTQEVR